MSPATLDQQPDDRRVLRLLFQATGLGFLVLLVGIGPWRSVQATATALMWALATLAVGTATGFLFGIPRVLQGGGESGGEPEEGESRERRLRYRVNTNLEQISDWLTKIIVGIGLVQLGEIPARFDATARFFAEGLAPVENAVAIAGATLAYFLVIGFLVGYLSTRLYVAGAISRADAVLVGGIPVSPEEATEQQREMIEDLRAYVRKLSSGAEPEARRAAAAAPERPQRILWVDDRPSNNAVLIGELRDAGIQVVTVGTTDEAMTQLEQVGFDAIISDLGRREGLRYKREAGLELLEKVRSAGLEQPFYLYTSQEAAQRIERRAMGAGATLVTASSSELLDRLAAL